MANDYLYYSNDFIIIKKLYTTNDKHPRQTIESVSFLSEGHCHGCSTLPVSSQHFAYRQNINSWCGDDRSGIIIIIIIL